VIKPHHITDKMEVKQGDILIYHTGYHHYYNGADQEDEQRYFLRHPGGDREFAEWVAEMQFAWTGFDCASGDHRINTSIRYKREDAARQYEKTIGKPIEDVFPADDIFVMHRVPFGAGVCHVENMGGDMEKVLNRRCLIGAFPIPTEGGEASPCRVVAFVDD
jgi:arylformamidase